MNKTDRSKAATHVILLIVLCVFFFGILIKFGVGIYNDSDQYITMHVRREPVYPVFLYLIRSLFGDNWMTAAGVIQTIIVIFASYDFVLYISDSAGFKAPGTYLTGILVMAPYIVTPFVSSMHVNLSVGIMSESIAMPMFLGFFVRMHKMLVRRKTGDMIAALLLAVVISLTRSNMIIMLIAWLIAALYVFIPRRKPVIILLIVAAFACSFAARGAVTRGYNLRFNGRNVGNEFTKQTVLANIFYATDRSAGERIVDDELREIFYGLYDQMDAWGYSYLYAGDSVADRAIYLEEVHDRVKFDVIEYGLRDVIEATGIHDYIDYNILAEEYCAQMIPILFPACITRWIPDMLIMGLRGVVRSVAVCNPAGYALAAVLFATAAGLMILLFREDKRSPGALMIALSLLLILGNAFGTAMIIMCISRYMVYGFAVFYSSLLIGVTELYRRRIK